MSDRKYPKSVEKALFLMSRGFCYAPTCKNPAVALDTDGHPYVIADIAHICAASKDGPRFDPRMTDVERRSFPNLLLLCAMHHGRVDDPRTWRNYPVEVLRRWKQEREQPLAAEMEGLRNVTEDDLRDMLEDSTSRLRAELVRSIGSLANTSNEVRDMLRSLVDEPFTRTQRDPQVLEYLEHGLRIMDALEEYGSKMYLAAQVLEGNGPTLSNFVDAVDSLGRAGALMDEMSALRKELEETQHWIKRNMDGWGR